MAKRAQTKARDLVRDINQEYKNLLEFQGGNDEKVNAYSAAAHIAYCTGFDEKGKAAEIEAKSLCEKLVTKAKDKPNRIFYKWKRDVLGNMIRRYFMYNGHNGKILLEGGCYAKKVSDQEEAELFGELRSHVNPELLKRLERQHDYSMILRGFREDSKIPGGLMDFEQPGWRVLSKLERRIRSSKELPNPRLPIIMGGMREAYDRIIKESKDKGPFNERFKDPKWKQRFKKLRQVTGISPTQEWIDSIVSSSMCEGSVEIIKGILDITETRMKDIKLYSFQYGYEHCVPTYKEAYDGSRDFGRQLDGYRWLRENTSVKPNKRALEGIKELYGRINKTLDVAGGTYYADLGITRQLNVKFKYPSEDFWMKKVKRIQEATGIKFKRTKKVSSN